MKTVFSCCLLLGQLLETFSFGGWTMMSTHRNRKCPVRLSLCISIAWLALSLLPPVLSETEKRGSLLHAALQYPVSTAHAANENPEDHSLSPHDKSDLKPDPAVIFGRLPNGFRYVMMENERPRDRVSLHLNIQAGSLHEAADQQGLAHFLEHMLFNGTTHFKPGELVKYFQRIGMEFGPDANAHTGYAETVYDIFLPDGSQESLKDALVVMKDYAEGALLLPSEIEKERKVILAEKRFRDSADYRTLVSTRKFEFPESLLSKRMPIGDEAVLKRAGQEQLKNMYDTWYRPETIVLVLVGDIDTVKTEMLIRERFATLSPRAPPEPTPDIGKIDHRGIKAFYHFEKETGNTTVGIEVLEKIDPIQDSIAFQKQTLIENVSNQIVQNRLNALIRQPGTPFTSASIGAGIFLKQIQYAEIFAECSPENWESALALLEQALRKALKYGFTRAELERVKRDIVAELDVAVKKSATRESPSLARGIIRHVNADRVFMSPQQEKVLYTSIINDLSLETVHGVFRAAWSPDHRLVLLTGNADLSPIGTDSEAYVLSVYNRSKGVIVERPEEIALITFPYLPAPKGAGRIADRKESPDLGLTRIVFENGVRLNLKKTDFKDDEVLINLSFGRGGSSEPADQPGLATLSVAVVNESGLGALDRDEIERALTGTNTRILFGINDDRFVLRGSTVSNEVELMFQLLYSHLIDPGYRDTALKLSKERFAQQFQALSRSIDGGMALQGIRFLAGGDRRFGLPSQSEIDGLTLEQIRLWVGTALKEDTLEMSIVGDFEMAGIIDLASTYLGMLPARQKTSGNEKTPVPKFPVSQSLLLGIKTEIPKGIAVVAYPTDDIWDIGKTRRLSMLSAVFSERLRVGIRETLGATYTTYAYNRPSRAYPGFGVFHAIVHVDPKEADSVLKEVKKISSELAGKVITDEEMQRALDPMLTGIKDQLRQNNYWLNTVLSGSTRHPRQIEWSRTIMTDYASITTDDLSLLAREYLDNQKSATIVIAPESMGK